MQFDPRSWAAHNTTLNSALLDVLFERLRSIVGGSGVQAGGGVAAAAERLGAVARDLEHEPAIVVLADMFGLDAFDRDVVMLTLGFEVDGRFSDLVSPLTVALAVAALPDSSWVSFDPDFELRRHRLIEIEPDLPLSQASLRLAPQVRGFLLGVPVSLEESGFTRVERSAPAVSGVNDEPVARLRAALAARESDADPVVGIYGGSEERRHDRASAAADMLGVNLAWLPVADLPTGGLELVAYLRSVERDARLHRDGVLFELGSGAGAVDVARVEKALRVLNVPVFVSGAQPLVFESRRPVIWHELTSPQPRERQDAWRAGLGRVIDARPRRTGTRRPAAKQIDAAAGRLAQDFRFDTAEVAQLCGEVGETIGPESGHALADLVPALRTAARRRTRSALERLATRLPTDHLPDLVLPAAQREAVDDFEMFVAFSHQVDESWGMAQAAEHGVTALFYGVPGTGKTLAARTLGRRLDLDVFRVDLSQTVSKYIGETERNLDQVFDAAERGGALVLFDEADSLFGRRAEVKDAQDRFANIQVSYLLQRLETSPTPIVLTTNLRDAIDPAFVRRLRVMVEFPFPDLAAREELWRKAFAPDVPVDGLDPRRLANLAITGATIADIARRAAFLAARSDTAVTTDLVRAAATVELRKLDRDVVGDF